jgi:hypothetical protein
VSTEAEGIVWIRHQVTTGEDTANWEDFMYAVVKVICEVCRTVKAWSLFVITRDNMKGFQPSHRVKLALDLQVT